ncbi:hypothetical protein KEM55_005183 [Ascosphaera atra]|nr:hypothetical protein KEM55_005183 [Ascosphaera atra]
MVQFFEMCEQARKDAAEPAEQLEKMMRLQWELMADLEGLKEFNQYEARDHHEDEAEKVGLPHKGKKADKCGDNDENDNVDG